MTENEVKVYDGKLDLQPVNTENINPILSLTIKKNDLSAGFEQSNGSQVLRFAKKRKIKRTRSSGIF